MADVSRFEFDEGKTYEVYPEIENRTVYFHNRFGIQPAASPLRQP